MDYTRVLKLLLLMILLKSVHLKDINTKLVSTMKSLMNEQVSPCQDFYQYACGNWETLNSRNSDNFVDTIGHLEYAINRKLKKILNEEIQFEKNKSNEIYQKVREYYKTCNEQKGFKARKYLKILKPTDTEEEWPAFNETWRPKEKWNIWSSLGCLQSVGFNGFLLTIDMKNRNATHFYFILNKHEKLGFSTYEQNLLDNMERSLNIQTRQFSTNIQDFNNKLAILYKNHNDEYGEEMNVEELQRTVINVDFKAYFTAILGEESLNHLPLVVANLAYFLKLGDLIQKTSQDTLIHTLKLKFLGYLEQQMPKSSSPLQCIQHMRELVPLALDFIYEEEVYRNHRNSSDVVIQKVFQTLQQKFSSIIKEHSAELKPEETEFLLEKIQLMKLNIGNLPQVEDHDFFYEYLSSWNVLEGHFYWNHLNALQHHHTEKFNRLNLQTYSPHHSYFQWPYVSPAYQATTNLIIITHAYMQYPIYHPEFHELFLYAELGNSLGHELIHAFDYNGLKYDGRGNPSNLFLESLPDKKQFMASLECLKKQRPASLNEKIADFSGFHLAYDSYFRRAVVPKFHKESILSNKQLFFIKFAQFFCAVNPKHIHYDDSHDPPFERVPQVVANHPEFEEIFGCERKTGKALVEKCNLW